MNIDFFVILILLIIAVWFAWKYFDLRKRINQYAQTIRNQNDFSGNLSGLENIVSLVNSLQTIFNLEKTNLSADNARLSTVLEQFTDGVILADAEGRVQFANPAACKLFGVDNPVQQTIAQVVRNFQLIEAWRRCQQTRLIQIETVELPMQKIFLQLTIIPDEYEGGSLLLAQDLTRVRKLESVRRDFISNVSHELRTPLASLKALTETLQNGALSDAEAGPRFLERIHTEVDALTQMTQELLDLSRIESGQVELNFSSISPKRLIQTAAERMKAQAERANINIIVEADEPTPTLRADYSRLEQVLVNLIHNAVKFTKPNSEIILSVSSSKNGVRFAVKDAGIGIPADSLNRIFERFYRVDSSRTGSGTGLGLSIAKHIVEAHNGKIWVKSEEGRGSTFYFVIPS